MRWYARPDNTAERLRVVPRLASWNKAGDPDQIRLRAYLDDTEALLAPSRIDGPWALRLDVGLPSGRDLLDAADLEQIHAAVGGQGELPAGPVRLELSFVVGPRRNWVNLWKQTIDSLDPILGRTTAERAWHPRDGRITELGMHVSVDPAAGNQVVVGIVGTQANRMRAERVSGRAD